MVSTQPAVLVPLTVTCRGQSIDMALPADLSLVELLPGMAAGLGRLTVEESTQGFRVHNSDGGELDQSQSLTEQGIQAGAVLTLEVAGSSATDARYDDLVEAIGQSVEATRIPWQRGDAVNLSAYSAVALFLIASGLLLLHHDGSFLTPVAQLLGAMLVCLAALVVARLPVANGAIALALSVPMLLAAAGFSAVAGEPTKLPLVLAGVGMLLGSAAVLVLPKANRSWGAGPITLGFGLLLVGCLTEFAQVPNQRAAALAVALLSVATLLAPWFGLSLIPARIPALARGVGEPIDPLAVRDQVQEAAEAATAVRAGAGLALALLTPLVIETSAGAALMAVVGISLLLGTRTLYGRLEVLVGVLSGMVVLILTGAWNAIIDPGSLPWVAGTAVLVASLILANNVISVRLRPWLTRLADALHIVALLLVLPLTAIVWGLA